jgi:N-acylneuraminate cytidylyltransferase
MNIAFIPVRGGSKSIPLKNIKLINGRPLIYWTLDAAVNCSSIDQVVVSTDSKEIREAVNKYNSQKVKLANRSQEVSTDTASTEAVMLEYAEKNSFNNIILIQATSPLLTSEDLQKGLSKYNEANIHSVLSVVRQKRFLWSEEQGKGTPVNYDFMHRPRRQEFSGFLVENGAFYITSRERLLETKCRISGTIGLVEMDEDSYFEIDEPSDWIIVENLLKRKNHASEELDLSNIKILLTDSDGVLTDGGMYYSENGDEMKKFNTKDGMGFQLLREKGIKTGIVTGENRELVRNRAVKMKVDELHMGISNKIEVIHSICAKHNISLSEVAYIGDDINDIEVIKSVGFGCCVNDAMESVKEVARYKTKTNGGQGAVREIAELILKSRTR